MTVYLSFHRWSAAFAKSAESLNLRFSHDIKPSSTIVRMPSLDTSPVHVSVTEASKLPKSVDATPSDLYRIKNFRVRNVSVDLMLRRTHQRISGKTSSPKP